MRNRLSIVSVSIIVAAMAVVSASCKNGAARSISRMLVASAMIAVAISAWACSSRVESRAESFDDWDVSPNASFSYSPGNIPDASASVAYVDLGDDSAIARSGYTDPRWEGAEVGGELASEASFPAANDRVLELPKVVGRNNTAADITDSFASER